jgi:hypothetical protein
MTAALTAVFAATVLTGLAAFSWSRRMLEPELALPEHHGADESWSPTEEAAAIEPADWDIEAQEELARSELHAALDQYETHMRTLIEKTFTSLEWT